MKIKAYVDGSYNATKNIYGSGIVIIFPDGTIIKKSLSGNNSELAAMRNVAGEILGAQYVMEYCVDNNIKELELYYDYTGIEYWCTGEWKANKKETQYYKDFYNYVVTGTVDVKFTKIKAHSGNTFNDIADELAKIAAEIED